MSKELPYFRFTVSEWLNGDISMETMEDQGVFANICAFYWFKDCSITLAKLKQKYSFATTSIERLLKSEILKLDDNDNIVIEFLNEQYITLSETHKERQKAGQKGGLSKAKNLLKQKGSYKDKDKDRDNIYTPKQFYELEKKKAEGRYKDKYLQFVAFLYGNNEVNEEFTGVLKLKKQVTFKQFCNLMIKIREINNKKGEQKIVLLDMIMSMYNTPSYIKGRITLYGILNNWINNER